MTRVIRWVRSASFCCRGWHLVRVGDRVRVRSRFRVRARARVGVGVGVSVRVRVRPHHFLQFSAPRACSPEEVAPDAWPGVRPSPPPAPG